MSAKTKAHTLAFLLVFATFGIAFGLDRLNVFLRQQVSLGAAPHLSTGSVLVSISLANVILALCVFWLYTNAFPALHPVALWIIAGLGLLVSFFPILYWSPIGLDLSIFLMGRFYFVSIGGFIGVAALFALYKMKKASA